MSLTNQLLSWLPIILCAGIGGRLLGRSRGLGLGIICAVFWVLLVQSSTGVAVWWDMSTFAVLLAGSVAIIAMGGWSGEVPLSLDENRGVGNEKHRQASSLAQAVSVGVNEPCVGVEELANALHSYEEWLEEFRYDADPWAQFDEFVRAMLRRLCGATHTMPLRLANGSEELIPLRVSNPFSDSDRLPARGGIIGHTLTTGRSFVSGDPAQGELVAKLAEESLVNQPAGASPAWCFAIKQGVKRFGVVVVGQLDSPPDRTESLLRVTERLVNLWWLTLHEICASRESAAGDPVSKLLSRETFFRVAERGCSESYALGEPVAMAVVAVEGLRQLNDSGRWEAADELIREIAGTLRRKVRLDDGLGRFDGSRFVVLLRRVDSELASLIMGQVLAQLSAICGELSRWGGQVQVRCGLAGSGTENPDVHTLVSRALRQCGEARKKGELIVGDFLSQRVPVESSP